MRVDRLVAILLLLQHRGQVTAAEVARELEVSERTARRDLESLLVAGVPIYSVRGRGGGWRLVGGARTDLSGFTASEARALFLVAGQASTAVPAVRAALRKLVHALPEPFQAQAEAAAASLVVDPYAWGQSGPPPRRGDVLDGLQDAVIRSVQVQLGYVDRGGTTTDRTVHPLGIVSKGPSWYLIADTEAGSRTFRVDRVTSVTLTGEAAHRPADFDLTQRWAEVVEEVDRRRNPMQAVVACSEEGVAKLRMISGDRLAVRGATDDGRIEVVVRGYNAYALAGELSGLGEWVEVLSPPSVRQRMAAIGQDLVERYGSPVSA